MDFKIEFTNKEITPWAGILLLKKSLVMKGRERVVYHDFV
jgi:hypothetical protein